MLLVYRVVSQEQGISIYISRIRKGCFCVCACVVVFGVAAAGTLHIQSIYGWLCLGQCSQLTTIMHLISSMAPAVFLM